MAGLNDPGVVDLVAEDADGDILLIIAHGEGWTDQPDELARLAEKINNYVRFAVGGELVRKFPEAAGRSVRIQIDCTDPPPAISAFLNDSEARLAEQSIGQVVNIIA